MHQSAFCFLDPCINFSILSEDSSWLNALISVTWSVEAFSFTPSFLHSLCISFSWRLVSSNTLSMGKVLCEWLKLSSFLYRLWLMKSDGLIFMLHFLFHAVKRERGPNSVPSRQRKRFFCVKFLQSAMMFSLGLHTSAVQLSSIWMQICWHSCSGGTTHKPSLKFYCLELACLWCHIPHQIGKQLMTP